MNENFNFFTHKIANPAGNTATWDEYLEKEAKEKASPEDNGSKTSPKVDINNDNVPGTNNDPFKDTKTKQTTNNSKEAAKEMGECSNAGKVTEEHDVASSAEPVVQQKINNDPNYQKGESTGASKEKKTEEKKTDDKEAKATTKKVKTAVSGSKFQKVASMNRKEKINLMGYLMASNKYPVAYVEALVNTKFANLTEEEKSFLKDYWSILEPESYAEEMVEDR